MPLAQATDLTAWNTLKVKSDPKAWRNTAFMPSSLARLVLMAPALAWHKPAMKASVTANALFYWLFSVSSDFPMLTRSSETSSLSS